MQWKSIAYDKNSCALHMDYIAYDKHSCAMHGNCIAYVWLASLFNALELKKRCIRIQFLMSSIVVQCIGIALLMIN